MGGAADEALRTLPILSVDGILDAVDLRRARNYQSFR